MIVEGLTHHRVPGQTNHHILNPKAPLPIPEITKVKSPHTSD